MKQGALRLISSPEDLLSIVAASLDQLTVEQIQKTLIVFPTRRLASRFILQTCPDGARLLPTIRTLNGFLQGLPGQEKTVVDSRSSELLLGVLLKSRPWKHLQPGLEHEIFQFFKEIEDHLLLEPFAALQRVLQEDVYQREEYLDSLAERFHELKELYELFSERLNRHSYATQTRAMQNRLEAAKAWLKDDDTSKRLGIEHIWLAGFTTMNQIFLSFCRDLLQDKAHRLYIHEPLRLFGSSPSPLADLIRELDVRQEFVVKSQTLPETEKSTIADLGIYRAKNPLEEVKVALDSARALLQGAGTLNAAEIAIILPTENPYATYLYALRKDYADLRMNLAVAVPIGMTHVGIGLQQLLRNYLQDSVRVLTEMTASARIQVLREQVSEYCIEAEKLWTDDPIQMQAIEQCLEFFGLDLHETLFVGFGMNDIEQLLQLLMQTAVRSVGDPLSGVQVLALDESRHMRFRYTFLLGAIEGSFPKAPPEDYLVDDFFKRRIGLPGWQALQARENTTFQLLLNHTDSLRLSFPTEINGQETVASRYIEILRGLYALPIEEYDDAGLTLDEPDLTGELPLSDVYFESLSPEKIPLFTKNRISVSELEILVQCPFRYVLQKQLGRLPKSPELEVIALQGQALHLSVEALFKNLSENRTDFLSCSSKDLMQRCYRGLCDSLDLHLPAFVEHELLRAQMREYGWTQFLETFQTVITEVTEGRSQVHYEEEFILGLGLLGESTNSEMARELQVRGRIDLRIATGQEQQVVDFKRRGLPIQKDVLVAKKPQLILYALAIQEMHKNQGEGGISCAYYSFLQGKLQPSLSSQGNKANLPRAQQALDEELRKLWQDLQGGQVLIDPSDCGFCELAGVCRKNDP